jgi:hypothetical protein
MKDEGGNDFEGTSEDEVNAAGLAANQLQWQISLDKF